MGYLAELFRFPGWASADELLVLHQRLAGSGGGEARAGRAAGARRPDGGALATDRDHVEGHAAAARDRAGARRDAALPLPRRADERPRPGGRRTVRRLLEELRRRGVAVLLNSHLLSEIELVCDRVAILSRGKIVAEGRPSDLARPRGVEVDVDGTTRLFEGVGREDVPELVAGLVAAGAQVYGVRVLETTLEEIYLEAVGERPE